MFPLPPSLMKYPLSSPMPVISLLARTLSANADLGHLLVLVRSAQLQGRLDSVSAIILPVKLSDLESSFPTRNNPPVILM